MTGKLVRDKIPAIAAAEGKPMRIQALNKNQYEDALLAKLHEEVREYVDAIASGDRQRILEEANDIQDVIIHMAVEVIGAEDLLDDLTEVGLKKIAEKGCFDAKLFWINAPEDQSENDE